MEYFEVSNVEATGLPLFEMKKIFDLDGDYKNISLNIVTIPPMSTVPKTGFSCHKEDEYAFFIEGELLTKSGGEEVLVKKGMATFIPRGEKHISENKTDKPCILVCMLVTPNE